MVALCRAAHLVALLSAFGTALFRVLVWRGTDTDALTPVLARIERASVVAALISLAIWFASQAALISGAETLTTALGALEPVAFDTRYGHLVLARGVLLVAALLLRGGAARRPRLIALVLAVAVASQAVFGHAAAITGVAGASMAVTVGLHIFAAGAWLGGLIPVFCAVAVLPHPAAVRAARSFGNIGLVAVTVLAGTAIAQAITLVGGLPGLFGTAYGHIALVKLGLFLGLIALAAANRFVLVPGLASDDGRTKRAALRRSIAAEAVLGLAVVIAAAILASLPPGAHEEPVWPFAWRPSLAAMAEPELRREVLAPWRTCRRGRAGGGWLAAVALASDRRCADPRGRRLALGQPAARPPPIRRPTPRRRPDLPRARSPRARRYIRRIARDATARRAGATDRRRHLCQSRRPI